MIRAALLILCMAGPAAALTAGDAGSTWTRPGASPCAQPDGSNPCWTSAFVPPAVLDSRAAGEFIDDEICDGDLMLNSYAHAGRAISTGPVIAAFDRAYLRDSGLVWRVDGEGRACIPSKSFDGWHEPEACGNRVRMLRRSGARAETMEFTRVGVASSSVANIADSGGLYASHGEASGTVRFASQSARGAIAREAAPLFLAYRPSTSVAYRPGAEGGVETPPVPPRSTAHTSRPPVVVSPPIPAVDLPGGAWLLPAGLAVMCLLKASSGRVG